VSNKQELIRDRFFTHMQAVVPGVVFAVKEESLLMRVLSWLLFFNKRFMSGYVTTVGNTIYMPASFLQRNDFGQVEVLAHEMQHIWDNRRLGSFVYTCMYLLPTLLFPFALLATIAAFAVYGSGMWLAWVALAMTAVLLLPLPSWGRLYIERRGYLLSIACVYWLDPADKERAISQAAVSLCNVGYYFPTWSVWKLAAWFTRQMEQIEQDTNNLNNDIEACVQDVSPVFTMTRAFVYNEKKRGTDERNA